MLFLFISKPDFSCNPYALWKYIKESTEHETAWLVTSKKHMEILRERGITCEMYDTYRGNELAAKAQYIISNVYVFNAIPKNENQVFVNLWHGSGIKAHDFYDVNLHSQQEKKVREFSEKTDLMCVHSLDDRFRLSAMLNYDLRKSYVTGQARLDCIEESEGIEKLVQIYGEHIKKYTSYIFFAPSFRANSSGHSGKFFSDNIFRLDDYQDDIFGEFLEENNIALFYKLHPIEQTALNGVEFSMNANCYSLTDEMLFDADIRYDEILNAFDIMISDYSSIAFDYLLLDRPIIYLIPDYQEYKSQKGFVFNNINQYMPGDKVYSFFELLESIQRNIEFPLRFKKERAFVREQRFDYRDKKSAKRCYEVIVNHTKKTDEVFSQNIRKLPSNAELLGKYIRNQEILDSVDIEISERVIEKKRHYLYIQGEVPDIYRSISKYASTEIADLQFYNKIKNAENIKRVLVEGGVDYEMFSKGSSRVKSTKKILGFAGTIDCRIYFAMIQYLCEAFPDYEIIFAGDIMGAYPAWLEGYGNLKYLGTFAYEKLPEIIYSFDIAILPFYGKYQLNVPTELFQYLACGKQVITSEMQNIPKCKAIYKSKTVVEAVENVKEAMKHLENLEIQREAKEVAKMYDWQLTAENIENYIVR